MALKWYGNRCWGGAWFNGKNTELAGGREWFDSRWYFVQIVFVSVFNWPISEMFSIIALKIHVFAHYVSLMCRE